VAAPSPFACRISRAGSGSGTWGTGRPPFRRGCRTRSKAGDGRDILLRLRVERSERLLLLAFRHHGSDSPPGDSPDAGTS
jgi:hypothetical protein